MMDGLDVSVRDHKAFAAKHLPDLGHAVKEFKAYTWKVTNWKKLESKLTSPEFDCGGHRWRVLLFPSGNSTIAPDATVSLYLDYADPKKAPGGWHACAQFALVISNPHDPTIYTVLHAKHRFIAEECDWGFTRFTELPKLLNVQDGHSRPTIENGSADITVYIRVMEDPTGFLWHNFVKSVIRISYDIDDAISYDSKKETGFVGLNNQGATMDGLDVSVRDHKAFAAKHLPDVGHAVKEFKAYTWKVTNWTKLETKVTSQEFDCGGHLWRVLLFPSGNSTIAPDATVSLYLDYADPKKAPGGWHACAQFALVISNPHDPTIYTVLHAKHRFIAEECDWGFTRFTELPKLLNVQDGHSRPTIEDGSADITVYIRVMEDPTGVLWHNFVNYDSKKETGFVGLKNQGATGYMNAVLQCLFSINSFRKAVYQIPTEEDSPTECVALALQRVFYHLQTSNEPVGTTELTKSFGWKAIDSFAQHDAQEFHRVLQDKLECKTKGTKAEGAIAKLYQGKMKSYIKCVNVDYESSRLEEFNDIQLNVKGMKNLYESFRDYVQVEMLDGEKKYRAEGFGLQDAKKGIIFESFPPVLHLHLKRVEYDIQRDAMVKINDRHEFPFEIDLDEFLDPSADRSQPWVYKLHSVVVHSGNMNNGRYFTLIKPDRETRWLKFDDDRVIPVTDEEVLGNFGGSVQHNQDLAKKRSTNALVYIRECAMNEVLSSISPEDTAHLERRLRLDEERLRFEARKREREEQHLFLTAKVVTDETFSRHEGFDLATFDGKKWLPSELPSFRILKTEIYSTFKRRVAHHFNYSEDQIRLWVIMNRQNQTVRTDAPIPENEPALTVETVRNNMAPRQNDLRLYLDVIADPSKPDIPPQSIMVFLKNFDTSKQALYGIGKVYIQKTAKVADLVPIINERMRWTPGTPLKFYEELKPGLIELMKPRLSFSKSEMKDGDIICCQIDLPEKEIQNLEVQGLYSNPVQFYDFLQNRVMITFKPKFEDSNPESEFSLVLSKKHNYDIIAQKVGGYLRHDPIKLRFTTRNLITGQPKSILKRSINQTIAEIMAPLYTSPTTTVILYEKLDISVVELETKRALTVTWMGIHKATHSFLLSKIPTIHDLADHLAKQVKLLPTGTGKIRIFEISKDGKTQKEFTGSEMIGNLPESVELYAEEIPREELKGVDGSDKVIGDDVELVGTQVFRSNLSISDLTYKVHNLNGEISRASASLVNSIIRSNQGISETELNQSLIRSKSLLGFSLAQMLQVEAKPGKLVNPLLVQVTLQALLVNFCANKIQLWNSKEPLVNEFLNSLYHQIRTSNDQTVSGRWRAVTRAQLRPETNTWLTELTRELHEVLMTAFWQVKSEDALRSFDARLEAIFKSVLDIRMTIGEEVTSADIEAHVVPPGSPFNKAQMEDEYPEDKPEGQPEVVIATTGMGLWRVVPPSAPNGSLAYAHILPPKIVLESTVTTYVERPAASKSAWQDGRD